MTVQRPNKPTVSFVIPSLGAGGAERVVANLANQLARDGYRVNIYTILDARETYEILPGVRHIHINVNNQNKALRIFNRFRMLRKYLREDEATTIIAFDRYYGICAALGLGKKVIGSERNDPYSNMPKVSIQKYFRDFLYRRVHCVVFQTDYAQQYFDAKIQAHSVIIPNPVSVEILPKREKEKHEKTIYTACRLTGQKNIPMALNAFAMFSKKYPEYQFVIYGDGPLKNDIVRMLESLQIKNKVRLAGYVDDLSQTVINAGMYISSSNYEGISNAMLEALAMGIPSICTDCPAGGARMAIEDGVNGILIPVGDVQALYEAMCRVAEDQAFADSIGSEAIKVRDRFNTAKIAGMWEALFE